MSPLLSSSHLPSRTARHRRTWSMRTITKVALCGSSVAAWCAGWSSTAKAQTTYTWTGNATPADPGWSNATNFLNGPIPLSDPTGTVLFNGADNVLGNLLPNLDANYSIF